MGDEAGIGQVGPGVRLGRRVVRFVPILALGAVALAVPACGVADDDAPAISVHDSAGIRIVENTPEASSDSCRISSEASVEIGTRAGSSKYQLHRVLDATRLSGGRIAVVNQGSSQIRLYDPHGRYLHAFGRQGEGPGEFRTVFQIWSTEGDTLVVGDYRPWRFFRFTTDGTLLEEARPLPLYPDSPDVMGILDDGTFVLGRECCRTTEPGFHDMQLHLLRHRRSGELIDTIGVYPRGRLGVLSREAGLVGTPLFEAKTRIAAAGDRIIVGLGTEREVRVLSPHGGLQAIVRWSGPDRKVTDAAVDTYRARTLARHEDRPELRRRLIEPRVSKDRPVADRFPAHATVLIDGRDNIWVRKYTRPSWPEGDAIRWLVFRRDGRFLCHAGMPAAIENVWDIHEIGEDYVLATVRDELDVEYVHLYRLETTGGPGR